MTTYQDIRGALQVRAVAASGFPPDGQRAYEGRAFEMTVGVPWASMTLLPTSDGPWTVSADKRFTYGLFQVDVYYPARGSPGTALAETCADNVIAQFKSGTALAQGSLTVIIDKAQRGPVQMTEDWLQCSVTISWRAYPSA